MSYKFTHSPFVMDVWVPFNGHRFKNTYMIRTRDGRELEAFPNGGAWGLPDNTWLEDSEVTEVKLLHTPRGRNFHRGAVRLKRDIDYFGTRYPVWCGDTFVWEDELPPGFRITPTEIYAVRIGEDTDERIKFMVARGVVVAETSNLPRLIDVEGYAVDPLFWWDDETKIFCHEDICNAIRYVYWHRKHICENIQDAEALDAMCERLFDRRVDWIPYRRFLVDLVKKQGIETVEMNLRSAMLIKNTQQTRFDLALENMPKHALGLGDKKARVAQAKEALNIIRGGRTHDRNNQTDLHHVLLRPDESPFVKDAALILNNA